MLLPIMELIELEQIKLYPLCWNIDMVTDDCQKQSCAFYCFPASYIPQSKDQNGNFAGKVRLA